MSNVGALRCPCHPKVELIQTTYETTYECVGCKTDGIKLGYKCPKCKYVLHSQCSNPQQFVRPSFLPHHTFTFMTSPISQNPKRYCDACGMRVRGFVYYCGSSNLDLHPCCASLQRIIEIDGHKYIFRTDTKLWNCHGCHSQRVKRTDSTIPGYCYVEDDDPGSGYHFYCVMNQVVEELKAMTMGTSKGTSLSKTTTNSGRSDKYFSVLKAIVDYVIAILSQDPIAIAKLVANDVIKVAKLLTYK
ncbi:hypothetical protein vseg_002761 [Gypsophila vaccaria]